jgi:hypothetical protein
MVILFLLLSQKFRLFIGGVIKRFGEAEAPLPKSG